ncbi:MAG: hypothetical protein ACP5XB_08430 [Isosphaeraceae bacterium]
MESHSTESKLVLTTETPARAAHNFRVMLVCAGLCPLVWCGCYYLTFTPTWGNLALLVLLEAFYVGLGILAVSGLQQGTCTFDDEGITYQPRKGPTKRLLWSRVERVKWTGIKILKGDGITIRLLLLPFARAELEQAIHFVESKLAADFDLSPVPRKPASPPTEFELSDPRLKSLALGSFVVFVGFSAAAVATALAPLAGTEFLLKAIRPLTFALLIFVWPFMTLPLVWVSLLLWVEHRKEGPWRRKIGQIHPAWPWRLRRQESVMLAKKAQAADDFHDWSL